MLMMHRTTGNLVLELSLLTESSTSLGSIHSSLTLLAFHRLPSIFVNLTAHMLFFFTE